MASSARHLFLLAFVAVLAVTTPRAGASGGGRFFFSKTTRPQATVDEPEKAAVGATTAVPAADVADPNSATAFPRPSTGGSGRGYGMYSRPEENFPPDYFRRGVHRNAEKLTTTNVPSTSAVEEAVPVGGRGNRAEPSAEDNGSGRGRPPWTSTEETVPVGGRGRERTEPFVEDNGSGRGRPPWTNTNVPTTTSTEEEVPVGGRGRDRAEPFVEGNGRGRAPWYGPDADGRPEEEQRNYGMSDTRLYQNGRYYYDVNAGRYGYGRESNPVRRNPEEFGGSGFGRGRYYGNAAGYQYGNGNVFGNGFQGEGQNGRYIP